MPCAPKTLPYVEHRDRKALMGILAFGSPSICIKESVGVRIAAHDTKPRMAHTSLSDFSLTLAKKAQVYALAASPRSDPKVFDPILRCKRLSKLKSLWSMFTPRGSRVLQSALALAFADIPAAQGYGFPNPLWVLTPAENAGHAIADCFHRVATDIHANRHSVFVALLTALHQGTHDSTYPKRTISYKPYLLRGQVQRCSIDGLGGDNPAARKVAATGQVHGSVAVGVVEAHRAI